MAHPQIAAFARMAKENAKPSRLVAGQATLLSRTMHDIRYDAVHDEFVVGNPFAQAILTFRGAANGEEAPIRILQGPSTQLSNPDRMELDLVHNEIFTPSGDSILVYPRDGKGNVAPLRVIRGSDTQLKNVDAIAVDPVHNVIVVGTNSHSGGGSLLIYNRTDEGNVKPRGIIHGPKAGIARIQQMQVYAPKGWIVATQPGVLAEEPEDAFVGIWSVNDTGDVPPRWKLVGGPKSVMKKPRGVVLNPKDKELIVADMRLNAVLTYYFPEIF